MAPASSLSICALPFSCVPFVPMSYPSLVSRFSVPGFAFSLLSAVLVRRSSGKGGSVGEGGFPPSAFCISAFCFSAICQRSAGRPDAVWSRASRPRNIIYYVFMFRQLKNHPARARTVMAGTNGAERNAEPSGWRSQRIAKYNRLLAIERELGKTARYGGAAFRARGQ